MHEEALLTPIPNAGETVTDDNKSDEGVLSGGEVSWNPDEILLRVDVVQVTTPRHRRDEVSCSRQGLGLPQCPHFSQQFLL